MQWFEGDIKIFQLNYENDVKIWLL